MSDTKSLSEIRTDKTIAALAELGGGGLRRDGILREEKPWNVPPSVGTIKDGAKHLLEVYKSDEEETNVTRTFNYRPWDGARAASKVMEEVFGGSVARPIPGFFGDTPPATISVTTGPGETEQVAWGHFQIAQLPGCTIMFDGTRDPKKGALFVINVNGPKKLESAIKGFFLLIEERLKTDSIYKGKAFVGTASDANTDFIDLKGFDESKIVYAGNVRKQLDANVWTLVKQTERCLRLGQQIKRAVLLHGPYGTGKTLTTKATAKVCVENGWTFIVAKPGDDLGATMETARLYEPAIVIYEDIDTIAKADQDDMAISKLLDAFDGIESKGTQVITLLTTNHPDKLHRGMMRPGRIDAFIEIKALDEEGVARLVQVTAGDKLARGFDMSPVVGALIEFLPSFIVESVNLATKYAVARTIDTPDAPITLDSEDIVNAAEELRPQHKRMQDALDNVHVVTVGDKLAELIAGSTQRAVLTQLDSDLLNGEGRRLLTELASATS